MSEKVITRKEIFMAKAAGEKVPDITPVTREEIFLSRIAGGSGADLLNADGVIKQEHLPEGYPYKTVEEGYILEECQPMFDEDSGGFILADPIEGIEANKEYTINWNGTEYKTNAVFVELDGVSAICFGNIGVLTGDESQMTDDSYAIAVFPADMVASLGAGAMLADLSGSTSLTLSIKGDVPIYHPISEKYLSIAPAVVNVTVDDTFKVVESDANFEKLLAQVLAGKDVKLYLKAPAQGFMFIGLMVAFDENVIRFAILGMGTVALWGLYSDNTWNPVSG